VLGLLVRAVGLLFWVIALPWLSWRRLRARTRADTHLVVEIEGGVTDVPPPRRRWWPASARPALSLHALREVLAAAARDPRVAGMVLVVKGLHGGTATAESLRAIVLRWREAGKKAVVHLPLGGGTRETFVAASADRVLLGPSAGLHAVGLLSATRYVRGALDRAGIVPEVTARGRYKTAAERIERTAMSGEQREQVEALLDTVHREVTLGIATGRRVDEPRARAMIDGAPYTGQEAVAAGIVDALAYEDQLAFLIDDNSRSRKARLVPADAWWNPRRALRPRVFESLGVIGVIPVHGAITGEGGLPLRGTAVDERVIAAVRLARVVPFVRGVVLHIDSPGGSALASDRMHHELAALAAEKPLVACMGDVAASGGYYVAAAAHAIVARRTTVTGSIGVIAARFALDPLFARLGIATEVLARGAHARLLDPLLPLGDDDRAALEREIDRTYQTFLAVVAENRKRSVDEIHALAQGRVWSGADAHARGLVDRIGGFEDAVDVVRARIGRRGAGCRVVRLHAPRRGLPVLDPPDRRAAKAIARTLETIAATVGIDPRWLAFRNHSTLMLAPEYLDLRT
jgi:protease-4